MTVIAWDGKTLACDRQMTAGDLVMRARKAQRLPDGRVAACCGSAAASMVLLKWLADGADPASYPAVQQSDEWCRLVVASAGHCLEYERHPLPTEICDPFMAWGSGRDLALGAMAAGVDARSAVRIANRYNTNCGRGVLAFRLR